jgi:hypothetical protein
VEPLLTINKTGVVILTDSSASGDAWDLVQYTVSIAHTTASTAAAYDLVLDDGLSRARYRTTSGKSARKKLSTVTRTSSSPAAPLAATVPLVIVVLPAPPCSTKNPLRYTVGFETAHVNNTAAMTYSSHPAAVNAGGRERAASDVATVLVESTPTLLMNLTRTSNPKPGAAKPARRESRT